jgi:6-phosphogluconolactonase (cycloisomerase 2 family)
MKAVSRIKTVSRMRSRRLAGVMTGGLLAGLAVATSASAAGAATTGIGGGHQPGSVFVQTDATDGNQIAVYDRAPDGALHAAGRYATGGLGGVLTGSVVDHLASQGSLVHDPGHGLLFAVNAGSNTVSVFAVHGDRLALRQVIGSGGTFPVSLAVHGDLVYVLNALDGGSIQGYRIDGGRLTTIPGSQRLLGLDPAATPQFTHTPGQVAFAPDGARLIVTTKANGSAVDVFAVDRHGLPAAAPVVNPEPGAVPFAIAFDRAGHPVIANAGTNSLTTYALNRNGTLTPLATAPTGQAATCWVAAVGPYLYASNAGSASVTGVRTSRTGALDLVGQTPTDHGTVDAAATGDGRYLYVQTGATGTVDGFGVATDGSLTPIGSVLVPGAVGGEGIAAS